MYNKVILIGNLTKEAELRYLPTGTPLTEFNLAVNTKRGDKDEVLFIAVTLFGKLAEAISKYLDKGKQVLVEGRLQEQRWEHDGRNYRKSVVIANQVRLLGLRGEAKSNEKDVEKNVPEEHSDLEPF